MSKQRNYALMPGLLIILIKSALTLENPTCDLSRVNRNSQAICNIIGTAQPAAAGGNGGCSGPVSPGTVVGLKCPTNFLDIFDRKLTRTCEATGNWSEETYGPICTRDCGRQIPENSVAQPWLAHISFRRTDRQDILCAGTLISRSVVITSAKCLSQGMPQPFEPKKLEVRFGNFNVEGKTTFIKGKKLFWSSKNSSESDLVLIELNEKVAFRTSCPACLPLGTYFENFEFLRSGESVMIYDRSQHRVNITVPNRNRCRETDPHNKSLLCASAFRQAPTAAPIGDYWKSTNGGLGLMVDVGRALIVGIATKGGQFGQNTNQISFTKIQAFIPWIDKTLKSIENPGEGKEVNKADNNLKIDNIQTWTFVQNRISKRSNSSVLILKQISYFCSDNIPLELFKGSDLSAAIDVLIEFSLVNNASHGGKSVISIQPELQEIVRFHLNEIKLEEQIVKSSVNLLESLFNTSLDIGVLDHAMVVWEHATKYQNLATQFITFHLKTYEKLNNYERYNDTISFANKYSKIIERIYGEDHEHVVYIQTQTKFAISKLEAVINKGQINNTGLDENNDTEVCSTDIYNLLEEQLGFSMAEFKLIDEALGFDNCLLGSCGSNFPEDCPL